MEIVGQLFDSYQMLLVEGGSKDDTVALIRYDQAYAIINIYLYILQLTIDLYSYRLIDLSYIFSLFNHLNP